MRLNAGRIRRDVYRSSRIWFAIAGVLRGRPSGVIDILVTASEHYARPHRLVVRRTCLVLNERELPVSFTCRLPVKLLTGTQQHIVTNSNTISPLICQGQHGVPGIGRTQSASVNTQQSTRLVFMVTSFIFQCPELNSLIDEPCGELFCIITSDDWMSQITLSEIIYFVVYITFFNSLIS